MKRLTNEEINKIKFMFQKGQKIREIARIFKVFPNTIIYHTNPEFRNRLREYNKQRYNEMSKEQKSELFDSKKDYQRNYRKKRYHTDKKFKEKQIEWSKKYQKENYTKR